MIKFVMCITRHPDMSREQFRDYWMNQHGPFFMKNADIMGAKKYVQSHTLDTPLNEGLQSSRNGVGRTDTPGTAPRPSAAGPGGSPVRSR